MFFSKIVATTLKILLCVTIFLYKHTGYCSSADKENAITIEFREEQYAGQKAERKPRALRDILESGELVVCIKGPILLSLDQDDSSADKMFQKTDIAFAKAMATTLGVRKLIFATNYKTYDAVVHAVENGEGDIGISNLSYTKERSRKVQFSIPYIREMGQTLLIDRKLLDDAEDSNLSSILNNDKVTIGAETNTSYQELVSKLFPLANLKTEDDWQREAVQDCTLGKISATIRDELRIKLLIHENPSLLFRFVPIILTDEPDLISAIVNLENTSLLEWTNTFIRNGYTRLSVDDIIKKYGGHVNELL
ncbi:MAG: transporter substrate-binding domain-containing protein [Holosporales bacterium]|jgi:ABC-type amino acid transport substrate-binding protein|nr:transporter substrate-binding domain-containing protein [Holosporales bacterium]